MAVRLILLPRLPDQEVVSFQQHLDFQLYLDQEDAQEDHQPVVVQETVMAVVVVVLLLFQAGHQ